MNRVGITVSFVSILPKYLYCPHKCHRIFFNVLCRIKDVSIERNLERKYIRIQRPEVLDRRTGSDFENFCVIFEWAQSICWTEPTESICDFFSEKYFCSIFNLFMVSKIFWLVSQSETRYRKLSLLAFDEYLTFLVSDCWTEIYPITEIDVILNNVIMTS